MDFLTLRTYRHNIHFYFLKSYIGYLILVEFVIVADHADGPAEFAAMNNLRAASISNNTCTSGANLYFK